MKLSKTKIEVKKRSVVIKGHKTSVSLEDRFWSGLKNICLNENKSINEVIFLIDRSKHLETGLATAIRDYVLEFYMEKKKSPLHSQ